MVALHIHAQTNNQKRSAAGPFAQRNSIRPHSVTGVSGAVTNHCVSKLSPPKPQKGSADPGGRRTLPDGGCISYGLKRRSRSEVVLILQFSGSQDALLIIFFASSSIFRRRSFQEALQHPTYHFFAQVPSENAVLGADLGRSWAVLGPSWAFLGPSWGRLGAILGPSWRHLAKPWGPETLILPWFLQHLRSIADLAPIFCSVSAILTYLSRSWAILGPSWARLWPSWAVLVPIFGPYWAVLGPSWAILGSSYNAGGTAKRSRWLPSFKR